MSTVVIVLSGPPKTGKSRLRGALYRALSRLEVKRGRRLRWFVQAFSPDSEGQWVNDAHALGRGDAAENLARSVKKVIRQSGAFFSPDWVKKARRQLEGLCRWADVVVADLGGLPSPENQAIILGLPVSYRVIILTREGDDGKWVDFWSTPRPTPFYVGPYYEGLAHKILEDLIR